MSLILALYFLLGVFRRHQEKGGVSNDANFTRTDWDALMNHPFNENEW